MSEKLSILVEDEFLLTTRWLRNNTRQRFSTAFGESEGTFIPCTFVWLIEESSNAIIETVSERL